MSGQALDAIVEACLDSEETDPAELFERIVSLESVRMHGPEHHFIDGACVLSAYAAAGGDIDLVSALEKLSDRAANMPGAMCAYWGVCGAAASTGAALAIIEGAGPLSSGEAWGGHMGCVSRALARMAEIGGPRCCKRNAYIAFEEAAAYLRHRYGVEVRCGRIAEGCGHSVENKQCLQSRCPFHKG